MAIPKESWIRKNIDFPFKILKQGSEYGRMGAGAHLHGFMELIYVVRGHVSIVVNGQFNTLRENDVLFIGPSSVHSVKDLNPGISRAYVIFFMPELIKSPFAESVEAGYINNFLDLFKSKDKYKIIESGEDNFNLPELFEEMYHTQEENDIGCELYLKSLFYKFIYIMAKNEYVYNTTNISSNDTVKDDFDKILSYIDAHYMDNLDMNYIANMMNLSYSYFSRQFKNVVGKSFKQYIDCVRVTKAEQLLKEKDVTIADISEAVGVSDVTTFYKIYKRVRGYSPSYFKKHVEREDWNFISAL